MVEFLSRDQKALICLVSYPYHTQGAKNSLCFNFQNQIVNAMSQSSVRIAMIISYI